MKTVLITGASSGIGEALARKLASRKQNLLLVSRNAEKLKSLCFELSEQYGINAEFIKADLAKIGAADQIFQESQLRGLEIEILINNAGIGSGGPFAELGLQSELDLIQLNNTSLVAMTHLFLQHMKSRRSGTIINVASMAAFMPVPYMAVYAASKVFVRSFTEALTEECKPDNIHIMLLCPGLTTTNFNQAAGIENEIGKALTEGASLQTPQQVAEETMKALDKKKNIIVSGSKNRMGAMMMALVPNKLIARFTAKNYQKAMKI